MQTDTESLFIIYKNFVGLLPLAEFGSVTDVTLGHQIFNITPGIFSELSLLNWAFQNQGKRCNVLLLGQDDSEDFELKGFDIAAVAVTQLNDTSYQLVFVVAPSGNGFRKKQLTVNHFLQIGKILLPCYLQLILLLYLQDRKDLV